MDLAHLDWPFFHAEHRLLVERAVCWAQKNLPVDAEGGELDSVCRSLVRSLGESGLLRYAVGGTSFGGAHEGIDARSVSLVREVLAYHQGIADFSFAMQGLGSGPISLYGNREQKERYLVPVARGDRVPAFALSEPEAGSDVGGLRTEIRRVKDGYVLNGCKTWVSNGGLADYYVVFARHPGTTGRKGISAVVVDASTKGLLVKERLEVIAPHPLATLTFEDCHIPQGQLLGEEGQGFEIAMKTLDTFRISVAAAAVGFARRALDESLDRSASRMLFGQPLMDFQLTRVKLAQMATLIDAAALLTYRAAWLRDRGGQVTKEAAMAKLAATEFAQQVIDAAVQLWGGLGVRRGEVVESLYREIRPLRIYEGATEIQYLIVARELLRMGAKGGVQ